MLHSIVLLFALLPHDVPRPDAGEATLNEQVLAFSQKNIGKKIGNGQCAGLAQEALEAAGAKQFFDYKEHPGAGDYVWGKLVYVVEAKEGVPTEEKTEGFELEPGDIIQLRNATFVGNRGNRPYRMTAPHHTAVLLAVNKEGTKWNVIQQNQNGKHQVSKGIYEITDLKEGWLRVYRPQPK
ncbi:MAG: hypothetical protein ACKVT0_01485 [Planctomycetaceae bacterium]